MIYSATVLGDVFLDSQQSTQSELDVALSIKFQKFTPEQVSESVYRALLTELFEEAEIDGDRVFTYHHKGKGIDENRGIRGMEFMKKSKHMFEVTLMPEGTNTKMMFRMNCPKPDDVISRLKAAQARIRDRETERTFKRKTSKETVSDGSRSSREDHNQVEVETNTKKMVVSASDIEIYRQLVEENKKKIAAVEIQESVIASDHHDRLRIHSKLKQVIEESKDEIIGFEEVVSGLENQIADLRLKLEDAKRNCITEREKRKCMEDQDREHVIALTSMRAQMAELSRTKKQLEKECSEAEQEIALFEAEQEQSAQVAIELMRAALENLPPERREHVLRQHSLQSVGL